MTRTRLALFAVAIAAVPIVSIVAGATATPVQEPKKADMTVPAPPPPRVEDQRADEHSLDSDALLATWISLDQERGNSMAQITLEKSRDDDVRQYARQVIHDRSRLVLQLRSFILNVATGKVGDADRARGDNAEDENTKEPDLTEARPLVDPTPRDEAVVVRNGAIDGTPDYVGLLIDLHRKRVQSTTEALNEKGGRQLDECYLGMECMLQSAAVDTIEVFRDHATPQLQIVLDGELKTAKTNLERAKALARTIDEKRAAER